MAKMEELRKKIDAIDAKILQELNERAKLILSVAEEKKKSKQAVFAPEREQQIIEALIKKNKGPFPNSALKNVFSEIISTSRNLEKPLKVAFLGPSTTFTHIAALKKFGSSTKLVPISSIDGVFKEVEKGKADFGVVPIENSTEGSVSNTYDMLLFSNLNIVAEIYLEIKHNLVSKYGMKEIKKLHSNPQALAQCREWITKNLPKAELMETSSTAKAAETASLYHSSAAIASDLAAQKYGLKVLKESIEDSPHNVTRFLVLGKEKPKKAGKNKTSIVYSVPHKPGALHSSLNPLHKNGINMTKIESRPTKQKQWEYVFFVDFEGHTEDEKVKKALRELEKLTVFLKIMGSYPLEINGV